MSRTIILTLLVVVALGTGYLVSQQIEEKNEDFGITLQGPDGEKKSISVDVE